MPLKKAVLKDVLRLHEYHLNNRWYKCNTFFLKFHVRRMERLMGHRVKVNKPLARKNKIHFPP